MGKLNAASERRIFFDEVRKSLFAGRLKRREVEGLNAVLAGWAKLDESAREAAGGNDALAYVLATAFHETAATMRPVRETLALSDADAIARLERAFRAGRLSTVKTPYWRPDAEGRTWLGRGFVQLTHRRNYEAMSALTGINLVSNPGRAMEIEVAVAILVSGMREGAFTGCRLGDYFAGGRADWAGARKIVNGTDRAELVAGYARAFRAALPRHVDAGRSAC
jgi:hypothetical protein